MANTINFTLWLFDLVGLTDVKQNEISEILNGRFLGNCRDARIVSTRTKWAPTPQSTIAPLKFDAVVFLVNNFRQSLLPIVGGARPAPGSESLGTTALGASGGGMAEVYWKRCVNISEVCTSLFHEAAHLKSGKGGEMHDAPGVRALAKKGSTAIHPSWSDLEFFTAAIKRPVQVRTKVPS
ncbi:MAG: hypothetical protein NVSMB6_22300 [Burkholderiaceae bacterium]